MTEYKSALVILGHLVTEEGLLNSESMARVALARRSLAEDDEIRLFTSGARYLPSMKYSLARLLANELQRDVPYPLDIIKLEESRDTVGDAYYFSRHIRLNNIRVESLTIVTSDYHCDRARYLFQRLLGAGCEIKTLGAIGFSPKSETSEYESKELFDKQFGRILTNDLDGFWSVMVKEHRFYKR